MTLEDQATESKIRQIMTDDNSRFIARYCKVSHTSAEIVRELMINKISSLRDLYERVVADNLASMENSKAIEYVEGKWQTTAITLRVLEKYFGQT
jgi:hypothetical protein